MISKIHTRIDSLNPHRYLELSIQLVKAKQTLLLLYTGIFTYLISGFTEGYDLTVFLLLFTSLFLAISGSTLLNMYVDRDIDAKMERTQNRPIPAGLISPSSILIWGLILSVIGVGIAYFINQITMLIIFAGVFFDVVMYSLFLKRRTKWSIVIGGVAGGLPALAGRTALTGKVDVIGIFFFLIILLWIPMHILSLATLPKNLRGYENANVPMWPVVSGVKQTRIVITLSAILEVLLIISTSRAINTNVITQIPLIFMGISIIWISFNNIREPTHQRTFRIFKLASIYMAIIFFWLFISITITPFLDRIMII